MEDETGPPTESPRDDPTQREWSKVRSILNESGYRFNAKFAQQKSNNKDLDPGEVLNYLAKQYERTAKMMAKTVTDHDSAVTYCKALDVSWKRFLKVSLGIIRECLPRESHSVSQQIHSQLRQRLLPRQEHWKAETQ